MHIKTRPAWGTKGLILKHIIVAPVFRILCISQTHSARHPQRAATVLVIARHTVRYGIVLTAHGDLQNLARTFCTEQCTVQCAVKHVPRMLPVCAAMAEFVIFEVALWDAGSL